MNIALDTGAATDRLSVWCHNTNTDDTLGPRLDSYQRARKSRSLSRHSAAIALAANVARESLSVLRPIDVSFWSSSTYGCRFQDVRESIAHDEASRETYRAFLLRKKHFGVLAAFEMSALEILQAEASAELSQELRPLEDHLDNVLNRFQ